MKTSSKLYSRKYFWKGTNVEETASTTELCQNRKRFVIKVSLVSERRVLYDNGSQTITPKRSVVLSIRPLLL